MSQFEQVLGAAEYRAQPLVVPQVSCRRSTCDTGGAISFAYRPHREERVKVPMREVVCHVCGRRSQIPAAALSAHCVHCCAHFETVSYVLHSGTRHRILRTLGDVTIPKGVKLSHLDIACSNLTVSGRVSGRFYATQKLELRGEAHINGDLKADFLSVTSSSRVVVDPSVVVQNAELRGELQGRLIAKGQVHVYADGKLLGDCRAEKLLLDPGAVHEGVRLH